MRADIADLNPARLDNAKCGCERYEIDGVSPAVKAALRSVVCFHVEGCLGVKDGKAVKPVLSRVEGKAVKK